MGDMLGVGGWIVVGKEGTRRGGKAYKTAVDHGLREDGVLDALGGVDLDAFVGGGHDDGLSYFLAV